MTEQNMMERPFVGVGVLVFKDGKILLAKRKGSYNGGNGTYSFPGGHLEFGESIEECARRETKEECGLDIADVKFQLIANNLFYTQENDIKQKFHYVLIVVTANWLHGEPQITEPDKSEEWNWYNMDNLPEPLFVPTKQGIESYLLKKNFMDSSGFVGI